MPGCVEIESDPNIVGYEGIGDLMCLEVEALGQWWDCWSLTEVVQLGALERLRVLLNQVKRCLFSSQVTAGVEVGMWKK